MSTWATFDIHPVTSEMTLELRHRVLRPMQTLAECSYSGDKQEQTLHAGCYLDGELVGVGTIFREDRESTGGRKGWRVRGMAVSAEARGHGCGGAILEVLLAHAQAQSPAGEEAEVWCNGRANVEGFYQRYGFQREGDIFDVPPIGPHVLMVKHISPE